VRLVPASEEAPPWEMAAIERDVSRSVETVGAMERPPTVGGGRPSAERRIEASSGSWEVRLPVRTLGEVETE